ncbi:transposase [Patescibacteria group bacterium]|nr:transposase [Patescibacteria group bacterium]
MKRNGHQCGKQRYRCLICNHSFIRHQRQSTSLSDFKAFSSFILGNKNRLQTAHDAQLSRKTLSKIFWQFFTHPLTPTAVNQVFPLVRTEAWVLALDGTWLRRQGVIMIYWNHTAGQCIAWSWETGETYFALASGLTRVIHEMSDQLPDGVVSDWKGSIVANVERYISAVPHQRCLAHVKRDIERLLPRHSPYPATLALRSIGFSLLSVKSMQEKKNWQLHLKAWQMIYGSVLTERSIPEVPTKTRRKWWYTHSNVRRAFRILTKDQDHLFQFLEHTGLPSTNNGLEGINSDLKIKLRNHRGMKAQQQFQFVSWYLTFKKVKKPADLKRLWDIWKHWK